MWMDGDITKTTVVIDTPTVSGKKPVLKVMVCK
jgi:hypothetical protein